MSGPRGIEGRGNSGGCVNLPVEVIGAVRENRCLVFVGSRFAAEARELAGVPAHTGREVAKSLGWRPARGIPGRRQGPITPSIAEAAAAREALNGRDAMLAELQTLSGAAGLQPTSAHGFVVDHFEKVFTTALDGLLEEAAAERGRAFAAVGPGEPLVDGPVIVRMRGSFGNQPVVTSADLGAVGWDDATKSEVRRLIRSHVVLFVGYRPDEEEFELLFDQLADAYRAELPRCHLAVAQGRIEDYQWQRWVWRGLLLFTADPTECMKALSDELK